MKKRQLWPFLLFFCLTPLVFAGAGFQGLDKTVNAVVAHFSGGDVLLQKVLGVTDGSSACTGCIGETLTISRVQSSAVSLTANTPANVTSPTSITLTAGEWQVSGAVGIAVNSTTTLTQIFGAASQISATIPSPDVTASPALGEYIAVQEYAGGTQVADAKSPTLTIPAYRVKVASGSTTPLFLVARVDFGGTSTACQAYGYLQAVRVR